MEIKEDNFNAIVIFAACQEEANRENKFLKM